MENIDVGCMAVQLLQQHVSYSRWRYHLQRSTAVGVLTSLFYSFIHSFMRSNISGNIGSKKKEENKDR
jgi:hypothetical protein